MNIITSNPPRGDTRKGPVETRHQAPTYFKTMVTSGYAPVNGLNMYYEIHGTAAGHDPPLARIGGRISLAGPRSAADRR